MGYGPPPLARDAYHEERLYWQRNPPKRPAGYITTKEAAQVLEMAPADMLKKKSLLRHLKRGGQIWWNAQEVADHKALRDDRKALREAKKRGG